MWAREISECIEALGSLSKGRKSRKRSEVADSHDQLYAVETRHPEEEKTCYTFITNSSAVWNNQTDGNISNFYFQSIR